MLQAGCRLDFPEEPFGSEHVRQLGPQHLDGHLTAVPEIVRQVNDRHSAAAESAFHTIAAGQRVRDEGLLVCHPERSRGGWDGRTLTEKVRDE